MTGGAGDDTYVVDNALDKVTEALAGVPGGTDTVESSITYILGLNVENLELTGSGNINGTGNTLNNTIIGNSGNNVLNGGLGVDTLIGGLGDDTYVYDGVDSITEGIDGGSDTVQLAYNISDAVLAPFPIFVDTFLGIENLTAVGTGRFFLTGNSNDNILIGNASNNMLVGGDGNDTLLSGAGVDTLDGGAGNDWLDGGLGDDTFYGGDGDDTYVLSAATDMINGDTSGNDTVQAGFTYSIASRADLENIALTGALAINATGNDEQNILTGNALANILIGGGDNDTLDGGAGADTLDGGLGADAMTGGAGNDTYVVDNAGDTVVESLALRRRHRPGQVLRGLHPRRQRREPHPARPGRAEHQRHRQRPGQHDHWQRRRQHLCGLAW